MGLKGLVLGCGRAQVAIEIWGLGRDSMFKDCLSTDVFPLELEGHMGIVFGSGERCIQSLYFRLISGKNIPRHIEKKVHFTAAVHTFQYFISKRTNTPYLSLLSWLLAA